jgi:hypothetical protein
VIQITPSEQFSRYIPSMRFPNLRLQRALRLRRKSRLKWEPVKFLLRKLRIHCLQTNLTLRRTECQTLARQFDLPGSSREQDAYIKLRWANAMQETRSLQLQLDHLLNS